MYNRVEIIPINLELNKQESMKRHALALKILLPHGVPKTEEGDSLKVHWTLVCHYLEETALTLEAVGSICDDPDVIIDATCAPLEEGKILVFEVLKKLEAVIAKVRARQGVTTMDADLAAKCNREANAYWKDYWQNH